MGDDDDAPVLLTTCADAVEATSIRAMLEADGIEVFVQGEHHRAQLGFLGSYVDLRILVRKSDLDVARESLEEARFAEHRPADASDPAEVDPSVQRWRKWSGDDDRDDVASSDAAPSGKPRPVAVPVLFALIVPFGTGHLVARRLTIALAIAVAQGLAWAQLLGGHSIAAIAILALVAYDAIGGALTVARDNAALRAAGSAAPRSRRESIS